MVAMLSRTQVFSQILCPVINAPNHSPFHGTAWPTLLMPDAIVNVGMMLVSLFLRLWLSRMHDSSEQAHDPAAETNGMNFLPTRSNRM